MAGAGICFSDVGFVFEEKFNLCADVGHLFLGGNSGDSECF